MSDSRFSSYKDALIGSHYPVATNNLLGGYSVAVGAEIGQFGLQLGNRQESAWVEINFSDPDGINGSPHSAVEMTIIEPQLVKIGRAAVIDTVALGVDDSLNIGRNEYHELGVYVSRRHLRLNVVGNSSGQPGVSLEVVDLGSKNGTHVRIKE